MKFNGVDISAVKATYDVCIVGSGPAGFTLALELKNSGLRICILESGGESLSSDLDDLKQVDSEGLLVMPDARERILGGTSETWSGFLAPLDQVDFEGRRQWQHGWPIEPDDIYRFVDDRGYRYLLPQRRQFDDLANGEEVHLPKEGLAHKVFLVQPKPFRFRKAFAYAVASQNLDLFLNATVVRLNVERSSGDTRISEAVIADGSGSLHTMKARIFVIAASAIESVRLLLHSGVGNEDDQLGRYFMNHPKGNIGWVKFASPLPPAHPLFLQRSKPFGHYIGLRLNEDLQHGQGLLNSYIRLERLKVSDSYERAARLRDASRNAKKAYRRRNARDFFSATASVVIRLHALDQVIARTIAKLRGSRESAVSAARLRCFVEMEPASENRITLGERHDRYGVPIPTVRHDLSKLAIDSVERLITEVSGALDRAGLGSVHRYTEPLKEILGVDAGHYLGGARMGSDPTNSVVDPSLRVHRVANLYVAGGAVFATGGCANPTFTIIGLSIRLADTLRNLLRTQPINAAVNGKAGAGVLIVGAGRRVAEDVIPTLEALAPIASVVGVYATGRKVVFGPAVTHEVHSLSKIDHAVLAGARIVYVAVPPDQLRAALTRLSQFDCRHLTLVVDTPALPSKSVDGLYERFARVVVAEDTAFLPWLELIGRDGDITHALFDRSGLKYHAAALGRAIAGINHPARVRIDSFTGKRNRIRISYSTGLVVELKGPKNHEVGRMEIRRSRGILVSSYPGVQVEQLRPVVSDHLCTGFALGETVALLSEVESKLLGKFSASDTIVSRMLDIKRVGLYRLLTQVLEGGRGYTLDDALEDNSARW